MDKEHEEDQRAKKIRGISPEVKRKDCLETREMPNEEIMEDIKL